MIKDCSALILAGGESRRMGQDKANLQLGERSLLQSVAAILQPLFEEVIVSVRETRPEISLPQVFDDARYYGPLAGLAAGLKRAHSPWLFVVACDMPFISPAVINDLAARRLSVEAVVPRVQGYPQPLAAFYSASCLTVVENCLAGSGKHSLRALLEKLQVRYVDETDLKMADPQLRSFFDLDTPQDVAIARNKDN